MSRQESGGGRTRGRLIAALSALIVAAVVVAWLLWPDAKPVAVPSPSPVAIITTPPPKPAYCGQTPTEPFTPTRIDIAQVGDSIHVIGLARDAKDLPSTPPLSAVGKTEFAWDKPPGLKPGSVSGNVLLNAHTWPDGSALGNRLLAKLHVNDQIIVKGKNAHLCYRVTQRIEVPGDSPYRPYYKDIGNPQVAIIVCSGTRIGPGNWTKRTIWFAAPATT